MTAPTVPTAPAQGAPAAPAPAQSSTAAAIDAARQRLAEGQPPVPAGGAPDAAQVPPEGFSVTLDGLEERGEGALELEVPDEETHQRLTRMKQEATVGRQIRTERRDIARADRELVEVQEMIATDPAGFILEHLPVPVQTEIAMQMMLDPVVLAEVQERLAAGESGTTITQLLDDPEALRTLQAELKTRRLELREALHQQLGQRRAMTANANAIVAEVDRLLPASITGERRALLVRDAVRDVADRARRLGLTQMDPRDVQLIIADRLREGLDLVGASAGQPSTGAAPRTAGRPAASGAAVPTRTADLFKLGRQIGLKALVERARRTT